MPDDVPDDIMAAADKAKHNADVRKDEVKRDVDKKDDVNEQRLERAEEKLADFRHAGRKHDRAD